MLIFSLISSPKNKFLKTFVLVIAVNFDPADTAKVQREMYLAMKARREQLEEALKKRTEELKMLCIKEGELTGVLPAETPLAPGEVPPQIRRRVGTAFSLSTYMVPDQNDQVMTRTILYRFFQAKV